MPTARAGLAARASAERPRIKRRFGHDRPPGFGPSSVTENRGGGNVPVPLRNGRAASIVPGPRFPIAAHGAPGRRLGGSASACAAASSRSAISTDFTWATRRWWAAPSSRARAEGRPALVATFDPHPVRYFKPDLPPFRLTTLDQRERLFGAAGADAMLVFHFDAELAAVTAPDFVTDYLVSRVGAAGVVTGEDFTFGKGRGGNVEVLTMLGQANRISVDAVAPVADGGEPVSSSRIRDALEAGDCATAARLLTRPFAIEGVVEHGDKTGPRRSAIRPPISRSAPICGRASASMRCAAGLPDGRMLDGVANLGTRPMFDPPKELLEPYFFDFAGDLYGQMRRGRADRLPPRRGEASTRSTRSRRRSPPTPTSARAAPRLMKLGRIVLLARRGGGGGPVDLQCLLDGVAAAGALLLVAHRGVAQPFDRATAGPLPARATSPAPINAHREHDLLDADRDRASARAASRSTSGRAPTARR